MRPGDVFDKELAKLGDVFKFQDPINKWVWLNLDKTPDGSCGQFLLLAGDPPGYYKEKLHQFSYGSVLAEKSVYLGNISTLGDMLC